VVFAYVRDVVKDIGRTCIVPLTQDGGGAHIGIIINQYHELVVRLFAGNGRNCSVPICQSDVELEFISGSRDCDWRSYEPSIARCAIDIDLGRLVQGGGNVGKVVLDPLSSCGKG